MVTEDWQVGFTVKGLRAPDEILLNDYVLIKGTKHDDAYVFLRTTIQNEQEKDDLTDNMKSVLKNLLEMYGLIANRYTEAVFGSVASKISSETPFGQTKYPPDALRMIAMPTDEQRKGNLPILEKTIEKFNIVRAICEDKHKRFLRNAIFYYYRSLGDFRLEEKLIDLMICLESLFSGGSHELRLRYSLRMAYLLGVNQEDSLQNVFRRVYALYPKRSKIVHGTEDVDLNDKEVWDFRKALNEVIKLFIHIEMSKKDLLTLLDESVYDVERKEQLRQIVSEATKKW